ncbi:MAG: FtsX-like permease family protein [Bacteroidales bacterium]
MIFSVSWRNVWRNKTRSLVIITAISLGIFAGVYTLAFMFGWIDQRVDAVINTEVSHIQIHHPRYLESNEVSYFIPGIDTIRQNILEKDDVKAVTARVIVNCMIASAETGSGIKLTGVDPSNEMQVTNIHEHIVDGAYFEGVSNNPIVIGEKLAGKLNVKVRSRVVITLAEMDGTLTGGAFRVAGIYHTSNTGYDEMNAFVIDRDLKDLLEINDNAGHQLAVLLDENIMTDPVTEDLRSEYPELQVMTWTQLLPEMQLLNENMNLMMYIFVGIILLALGFGIVNTMLMVILERVKELGMLMAVGMNRVRIFGMIILESVFLSLTGGAVGIVLALILTAVTARTGVDLSLWAEGLHSVGYASVVYPRIGLDSVIAVTILVIITGILSAVYPARKAVRLNPAEALRIDM